MLTKIVYRNIQSFSKLSSYAVLTRNSFSSKGEERVAGRLKGLLQTDEQIEEAMKEHYDEEGSYTPPHASTFPSMTKRDVMMNVRIPPLGIVPPPFSDDHIREVNSLETFLKYPSTLCFICIVD